MMEEWKNIQGYEGYYQVSNLGNVRSLKRWIINVNGTMQLLDGKLLTPVITQKGYYMVAFSKKGRVKHYAIHRLVAQAFIPNVENKPCVNHLNGIKTDNGVTNLEWCTNFENVVHAACNGLRPPLNYKFPKNIRHPKQENVSKFPKKRRMRRRKGFVLSLVE